MAGEWPIKQLGEIVINLDSKRIPLSSRERERRRGHYPYYGANGVIDYVDDFLFDGLHVLIAEDGSVEKDDGTPFVQIVEGKFWVNNHAHVLRASTDIDTKFLYYALSTIRVRPFLTGSVQAKLSQQNLNRIPIPYPPEVERRAIAAVLGALDDKIELNRRMNRTLEAIAQAVFRHWFVENEEAEGWEIRTLGDICEFAYGKGLKEEERVSGPIPVYGSNGQIGWHNEPLVKGPGIVVGRKGNPGIVTWVHTDFFPIDTTFYVEIKDKETSLYWLYYMLVSLNLSNLAADSAVPGLNRNFAYMSELVYPPTDLMKKFDDVIKPLFAKIHANEQQSRTLAALRDALLPKLLRGEVRVTVQE